MVDGIWLTCRQRGVLAKIVVVMIFIFVSRLLDLVLILILILTFKKKKKNTTQKAHCADKRLKKAPSPEPKRTQADWQHSINLWMINSQII